MDRHQRLLRLATLRFALRYQFNVFHEFKVFHKFNVLNQFEVFDELNVFCRIIDPINLIKESHGGGGLEKGTLSLKSGARMTLDCDPSTSQSSSAGTSANKTTELLK